MIRALTRRSPYNRTAGNIQQAPTARIMERMSKHRHAPRRDNIIDAAGWAGPRQAAPRPDDSEAPFRLVSQKAVKRLAFGCFIVGAMFGAAFAALILAVFP